MCARARARVCFRARACVCVFLRARACVWTAGDDFDFDGGFVNVAADAAHGAVVEDLTAMLAALFEWPGGDGVGGAAVAPVAHAAPTAR